MSRRTTVAVLLALAVVLTACGGGGKKKAATTTTHRSTTTAAPTTTAAERNPLRGTPVTDPNALKRPALVIKIDNADPDARPQNGLDQADVVFEEKVEGNVTRLAAVFQSQGAANVGPTRSGRTTDVYIVSMLNHPLFAFSGANPGIMATLRSSPLVDMGFDKLNGAHYSRRRAAGHRPPHDLYVNHTDELWNIAPAGSPPPPLFAYRAKGEAVPADAKGAEHIHVSFGSGAGSAPVDYQWDGSRYARSQKGRAQVDEAGHQFAPENVVIQFVDYVPTQYVDVTGSRVPEAKMIGSGDAFVFTNGKLIYGRWNRPDPNQPTQFVGADGQPIKLTPGRTWVELAPPGSVTAS
jgi:hypothetical protein